MFPDTDAGFFGDRYNLHGGSVADDTAGQCEECVASECLLAVSRVGESSPKPGSDRLSCMRLDQFRKNVYSQNGEDGVIAEIAARLGLVFDSTSWCVEFGAWNGVHLSNTFALVEAANVNAVYIEGDATKFGALLETAGRFSGIKPVRSMVVARTGSAKEAEGRFPRGEEATLDEILESTDCPRDYDLLSIDIDSYDLEVWESHKHFNPKIVIVEVNSSIPPGVLQWHSPETLGNSLSSTLAVAEEKGYSLVCHTGNAIFVRDDLVPELRLEKLDLAFPERLFNPDWMLEASLLRGQNRAQKRSLLAYVGRRFGRGR